MRLSMSWLRELVAVPANQSGRDVAERLIAAGLEVETVETVGEGLSGPIVVGRVVKIEELTEFKKPIRWCQVDIGGGEPSGIICGARNFAEGDLVVVAPPGTTLPGDFTITARKTYDHVSNGMICSERELGLGDDHAGIIVLPPETGAPGDDAAVILGVGDEVLDIAVTPDRGYALSARGLAREVAISYDLAFEDPADFAETLAAPAGEVVPAPCASDDLDACPLFTLRTITSFDPSQPTPQWMRNRLRDCGMRSVSLAVDITNYVMLELGQPLHAFDLDALQGTVRVARAQPGEQLQTIDHVVRDLDASDLTIRDDRGPIGLAGTMGGADTEISDSTTNIALEAAFFDAAVVARMARRHRLSSEASRRFERGIDRALAPVASARGAELLVELGGGHYQGMTAVEAPMEPLTIAMAADLPERVAGMSIDDATVTAKLSAIGSDVEMGSESLLVTPPTWRPDLTDPADLVEEVVRLVGYEMLPSTLPTAPAGHGITWAQRLRRRVGAVLASRGMVEVLTYPFTSESDADSLRWNDDDPRRRTPRLANPLSDEQPMLRGAILPTLLGAAARNVGRGMTDFAIFETGTVFLGAAGNAEHVRPGVTQRPTDEQWAALESLLPDQPEHLGVVLVGDRLEKGWWGPARTFAWSDALEIARVAIAACGVENSRVRVEPAHDLSFHPGRSAAITVDGLFVGVAGELHPGVVEVWGLPARACAAELDLNTLIECGRDATTAPDFSTHPVAKEDIALVVGEAVPAESVRGSLIAGAGELLESVTLFDVYAGDQVPAGSKSLAFALRFRAPDRTLEAQEIADARTGAIEQAARDHGAQLR